MTARFLILGTDDSVNTCDCCGKTGLKSTVIVDVQGEVFHYGSTCATRHTGMKPGAITRAIADRAARQAAAIEAAYLATPEHARYSARMAEAHALRLVGRPFADYCAVERRAADAARAAIRA